VSASKDRMSEISTRVDNVRVAERYVGAYNDRDLDAMLAVMDENVVSHPAPLFGHRPHVGHAGVRAWWATMVASDHSFDVVVTGTRQIYPDRVAVFGELRSRGARLGPWAVVVLIRNGLIIESRSYLSGEDLLADLGLLGGPAITDGSESSPLR
jgi:ketosteroid isomerase-like protein